MVLIPLASVYIVLQFVLMQAFCVGFMMLIQSKKNQPIVLFFKILKLHLVFYITIDTAVHKILNSPVT